MLMHDKIMRYLEYIDAAWPKLFPGLTIEYGREGYGPLSIYVIVKYGNFSIKRVFYVDHMIDRDGDTALEYFKNTIKHMRDEVIEKEEKRRDMRAVPYIDYNRVSPLPLIQTRPMPMPKPKKIILNDPATIILWSDNTKTIVKKNSKDKKFDPEKGIALCYMKKALGNKGNYNNVFKEWIK